MRPGLDQGDELTLELLIIGTAIALDPLPLGVFLVVLPSKRGVVKGAAFIFGWLLSLGVVVTLTVVATGNQPPRSNTAPTIAALVSKIVLGVGLIAIAFRQRRNADKPKVKKTPKWQARVDDMSYWFALALGPLVQPWGLVAAGAATAIQAKVSSFESFLALFGFCLLATATYLTLEIYAVARPVQSDVLLARMRTWIDTHLDQVIVVGSLTVGIWLIGQSIYTLVS